MILSCLKRNQTRRKLSNLIGERTENDAVLEWIQSNRQFYQVRPSFEAVDIPTGATTVTLRGVEPENPPDYRSDFTPIETPSPPPNYEEAIKISTKQTTDL